MDGGIVDDLMVYRFNETKYMLVVNASNIEKDWEWINQYVSGDVTLSNISDDLSLFAVQGPKATDALQSLTDTDLAAIKFYHFTQGSFAGVDNVIISATGYTGAGGFELYVPNSDAQKVWDAIMAAGESFGIKPTGLGARDTLRMEMGYCLYGNDINDTTSPLEAGLGWITKFTKDFVNSDTLKAQKEAWVSRKRVGFILEDRCIPRQGYEIHDGGGNKIGDVTSGTMSPTLSKGIGLGYVSLDYSTPGSEIYIVVRNRALKAVVKKLPLI